MLRSSLPQLARILCGGIIVGSTRRMGVERGRSVGCVWRALRTQVMRLECVRYGSASERSEEALAYGLMAKQLMRREVGAAAYAGPD